MEQLRQQIHQSPDSYEDLSVLPAIKDMKKHYKLELKILVAGRSGSGKSTLVNALFACTDASVTKEGCTKGVRCCNSIANGVTIHICDYDVVFQQQDVKYIPMIGKADKGYDLSLFCINMAATRPDIIDTMEALSKAFSKEDLDYWNNTIIVLTFANVLPHASITEDSAQQDKIFKRELKSWKKIIKEVLIEYVGVPTTTAEKVPIIPAGYYRKPHLFYIRNWLSELWMQCLLRTNELAAASLLVANASRIHYPRESLYV